MYCIFTWKDQSGHRAMEVAVVENAEAPYIENTLHDLEEKGCIGIECHCYGDDELDKMFDHIIKHFE